MIKVYYYREEDGPSFVVLLKIKFTLAARFCRRGAGLLKVARSHKHPHCGKRVRTYPKTAARASSVYGLGA